MTTWNPRANELFLKALELGSPGERQDYLDGACAGDAALRAEVEALLEANSRAGSFLASPAAGHPLPQGGEEEAVRGVATVDAPSAGERPGVAIGPYKLLEQIGEGGFGVVYMAEQQQPVRRKVALKVLKPGMDTRQVVARFEAERQALALMDHPHIAHVFDGGQTPSGRPYFVMELVKGVPITDFCDQNRLTPRQRLELFLSVCHAVQHAHQKGIIHRDLKPSNVLVTVHDTTPVVKVIDFGVAKALGQELTDKTLFTGFAQMIGTPLYMSPEQAGQSGLDVDTRSDIYSLGVLLYELLTGTTPFDKERLKKASYEEIRRIIREEEPPRPSTRISTLGQAAATVSANRQSDPQKLGRLVRGELDWIVMRALEKDRNRRYESVGAFAADVQRYLNDEPVQACPPSAWYRFRKFARRHKAALTATSAAFLVVVLGVIGLAVSYLLLASEKERVAREKERGDQHLARAKKVIGDFLAKTAEDRRLKYAGLHDLRKDLLTSTVVFLEEIARQEGEGTVLRRERAWAQHRLAEVWREVGEDEKALHHCDLARAGWESLAADFPAALLHREQLAECDNQRGALLTNLNRLDEGERSLRQALGVQEQLAAEFPAVAGHRSKVGAILHHLSVVERRRGKPQEEKRLLEQAIGAQRAALGVAPHDRSIRLFLAHHLVNLEVALREMGQPAEAAKALGETRAIYEALLAEFPAEPVYRAGLAACCINLGNQLRPRRELAKAANAFGQAVTILDKLAAEFPADPDYRGHLARAQHSLGDALEHLGRSEEAEAAYGKALSLREDLYKQHPAAADHAQELGVSLIRQGLHEADSERFAAALGPLTRAIAILEPLAAPAGQIPGLAEQLRNAHGARADVLLRLGRHAEAVQDYDRGLALDDGKQKEYFRMERALALAHLNDHAQAAAEAEAVAATPALPAYLLHDAAAVHALCSAAAHDDGPLAERYASRAVDLLRRAFQKNYRAIAEEVRKDPNLKVLRSREDFRKLCQEWEGKDKR
jgi:serine/threonine protein kinase